MVMTQCTQESSRAMVKKYLIMTPVIILLLVQNSVWFGIVNAGDMNNKYVLITRIKPVCSQQKKAADCPIINLLSVSTGVPRKFYKRRFSPREFLYVSSDEKSNSESEPNTSESLCDR